MNNESETTTEITSYFDRKGGNSQRDSGGNNDGIGLDG